MGKKYDPKTGEEIKDGKPGWLDWLPDILNPTKWSLGGIFHLLLFATGAYFLLKNEKVQEWIGKISPDAQEWLHKNLGNVGLMLKGLTGKKADVFNDMTFETSNLLKGQISDSVYNVITKDKTTFDAFQGTLKAANGGKINDLDDMTSEQSLVALATKQPGLTAGLLKALITSTDAEDKKMTAKLMTTLNTMFDKDHRQTTIAKFSGPLNIDPKTFAAILDNPTLVVDGKVTPTLMALLVTALETKAKTTDAGTKKETSMKLPDPSDQNPMMGTLKTMVGEINTRPLSVLQKKWGDQKFNDFATSLATGAATSNFSDTTKFVLQSENRAGWDLFTDAVYIPSLPAPMQEPVAKWRMLSPEMKNTINKIADNGVDPDLLKQCFTVTTMATDANGNQVIVPVLDANNKPVTPAPGFIMFRMMDKDVRDLITKAGVENVATLMGNAMPENQAMFTAHNIKTLMGSMEALAGNPANLTDRSASAVLNAFAEFLTHKNVLPLQQLEASNHGLISAFFQDTRDCAVATNLVQNLTLSGPQGAVLDALKAEWGNKDDGILQVFMDPASTTRLIKILTDAPDADKLGAWETYVWSGDKLSKNARHFEKLKQALDVTNGTTVTPRMAFSSLPMARQEL